jgi:putative sterol carrier protein
MTTYYYCTPEWLKESKEIYNSNSQAKEKLKKLSAKMAYRVKAEPSWGINKDIYFCANFESGELNKLELVSKEAAYDAQYLMAATPKIWKNVLTKESKFITDFMLGRIKLDNGSKVGVLTVAPHANNVIDALVPASMTLVFPDELPADELEQYRSNMVEFRKELGV